jgi:hypothetical protein
MQVPERTTPLSGEMTLSWLTDNFYPRNTDAAAWWVISWLDRAHKITLCMTVSVTGKDGRTEVRDATNAERVEAYFPLHLARELIHDFRQSPDFQRNYAESLECPASAHLRRSKGDAYVNKLIDRTVEVRSELRQEAA